jgi:hypothetical protein
MTDSRVVADGSDASGHTPIRGHPWNSVKPIRTHQGPEIGRKTPANRAWAHVASVRRPARGTMTGPENA